MWRPRYSRLFGRFHLPVCGLLLTATCVLPLLAQSQDAIPKFTPDQLEFFEKQVRPLLAKRCYSCHSAKTEKLKGGLRLDSRSLLLKGGDTGPAAVPGKPGESLLVDAINYGEVYQMPPKFRLPDKEVAVLTRWVAEGLPWPDGEMTAGPDSASEWGSWLRVSERLVPMEFWEGAFGVRFPPDSTKNIVPQNSCRLTSGRIQ